MIRLEFPSTQTIFPSSLLPVLQAVNAVTGKGRNSESNLKYRTFVVVTLFPMQRCAWSALESACLCVDTEDHLVESLQLSPVIA